MKVLENQKLTGKKFGYVFDNNKLINHYKEKRLNFPVNVYFADSTEYRHFNETHPKRQVIAQIAYHPHKQFIVWFYPVLSNVLEETGHVTSRSILDTIEKKLYEIQKNDTDAEVQFCFDCSSSEFMFTNKPCYHKKHCSIHRNKYKVTDKGFKNPGKLY